MATIASNNVRVSKSMVMKAAWAILKNKDVPNIAEALRKAWQAMKIKAQMYVGVVEFTFRKANGEIRKAVGTLKGSAINYDYKNSDRKPCYSAVAYWDIEKNAFRSFSISSLL